MSGTLAGSVLAPHPLVGARGREAAARAKDHETAPETAPEADPDAELVARWRAGDARAFEELVKRHERRVFRFLVRMLGDVRDAEDVTQDAFLNLHRHGHRFRGEARFSTFLYRIAANAALNRRRTLGRYRRRIEELLGRHESGMDDPVAPRDPESAVAGSEIDRQVQRALLSLPESLRLPVVLCDIEGLGYREIAQTLGLREGTVKSRIHRGRLALRDRLVALGTLGGSGGGA